jgi:hypothetical protein
MAPELKNIIPVELRSVGLDEKWLQQRIIDDPGLLGLGELEIASREHRQPLGGRIDFLMRDEAETYYAVEIMLGHLDESHIIRTIEYWDIERQRRPQCDHRAVIVAEQITTRFFNVLRLLNRTVRMIAIKLSAFQLADSSVVIHPVTVLDVIQEFGDVNVVDQVEQADRAYWEKKSDISSLGVMDKIVNSLRSSNIEPKLTYNRHHIALGTTGYNFCWFHPRKSAGHCHVEFRVTPDTRDVLLSSLQAAGLDASPKRADIIGVSLTTKRLEDHLEVILDVLKRAEEAWR